jgi:dimethylaniline monooxygenase (N-oxide forming)
MWLMRQPQGLHRRIAARPLDVCVIGAGLSGLVTIKELLDEGHRVMCFEREPREGGNFNHPAGAAYDTMYLTTSQYFTAFSSFPPPFDQKPRHWSRQEYADYLHDFCVEFRLLSHIHFSMEVVKVRQVQDGSGGSGPRFEVERRDSRTGTSTVSVFDAIAICTGPHAIRTPRVPSFPGAARFRGKIEHAASYKSPQPYRGKHVVCVGFGETAADVAGQIANVAASCWVSFRRHPAILPRYIGKGAQRHPNDAFLSRLVHALPRSVLNRLLLRRARRVLNGPPGTTSPRDRLIAEWRIKGGTPAHQPFQKNDDFLDSILAGTLRVKPFGIERIEEHAVVFTDGSRVKADVVMCCTGFDENTPPVGIEGARPLVVRDLYKHAIHPDFGGRVAYIGWARPVQGGVPACSELQARYFALLCSGTRTLPEPAALRRLIEQDRDSEERSFHTRKSVGTICSYTPYLESLAELIGCRPRIRDHVFEPRVAYRLLCGSNVASTYRLRGPHAQPELAKRVMLHLPVAHGLKEMVGLGVLYVLSRVGLLREPAHPGEDPGGRDARAPRVLHVETAEQESPRTFVPDRSASAQMAETEAERHRHPAESPTGGPAAALS